MTEGQRLQRDYEAQRRAWRVDHPIIEVCEPYRREPVLLEPRVGLLSKA